MNAHARALALALALPLALLLSTARAVPQPAVAPFVTVELIALNDLHGHLDATETFPLPDPADPAKTARVPVGGAAYLAGAIARLRAAHPYHVVVGAGDMVGASPLSSGLEHDEPTLTALDVMGLEITSVGNHEFDHGVAELQRKAGGGCAPDGRIAIDTCIDGPFPGTAFHYLAANVIDTASGKPLFPASEVRTFAVPGGTVRIGFIGVLLKETDAITNPSGTRGVRFVDEANAINAEARVLQAQGVRALVVLIHQGIATSGGYDDHSCPGPSGDLLPILDRLDPAIRLVVSGHTHRAYVCPAGQGTKAHRIFYTSAGRYGVFVTDIGLTLDVARGTISGIVAHNVPVVNDTRPNPLASAFPAEIPDPRVAEIARRAAVANAPLISRIVGRIAAEMPSQPPAAGSSGESALGDVIADARLAATNGGPQPAVAAFMNPGGVRATLRYRTPDGGQPGDVTYGDTYDVAPFGDDLITLTLTGKQLYELLAEQWAGVESGGKILSVSQGVHYTWDAARPATAKVVPGSLTIGGRRVEPAAAYRITVDDFLASGGDGFVVLRAGAAKVVGPLDRDALNAYLHDRAPVAPPPADRIVRLH